MLRRGNSRRTIVVVSNFDSYYFSTYHCQEHSEDFVPVSFDVDIRESVKNIVSTYYYDMKEIPNPDKNFQPIF